MGVPASSGGDPSYTLSFPTGDNLKEDEFSLEKAYSHFRPNLENVDTKTQVLQLRASPTPGLPYSHPSLAPPNPY